MVSAGALTPRWRDWQAHSNRPMALRQVRANRWRWASMKLPRAADPTAQVPPASRTPEPEAAPAPVAGAPQKCDSRSLLLLQALVAKGAVPREPQAVSSMEVRLAFDQNARAGRYDFTPMSYQI